MKNNPNQLDIQTSILPPAYQSSEEIEEIMLQELESIFDKPCLIPVIASQEQQKSQNSSQNSNMQQQQTQPSVSQQQQTNYPTSFKVGYDKDYTNTFLITNPQAIFKVFSKDQFLQLAESSQCILIDRLDDILQKCSHNSLVLTDHIVLTNVTRLNQLHIDQMMKLARENKESDNQLQQDPQTSQRQSHSKQFIPEHDILLLSVQLCLKLSTTNKNSSKKLLNLIRKLTYGKRFLRCHLEYVYQYLKIRCSKLSRKSKTQSALSKLDTALRILTNMFEQRFEVGPSNYFYFSGFLSGIQVISKTIQSAEFIKGFTACIWFYIQENTLQDDKNLPVLFNCFFQGQGGFECYFNERKLFYRILGKNYSPPTIESNGILIGEFLPKKWYFLATEHERPSFTRPQFTAIINDKQVVNLPLDYPKIDKNAKISMISICKNFVGQLSTFMIFKEPVNNSKKLIQVKQYLSLIIMYQMYHNYEFGIFNNSQMIVNPYNKNSSSSGTSLNSDIFDQKFIDKMLILYNPDRTSNKTIYDCVEMRDAELMINSGVCVTGPKSKLFYSGGLASFLPLLDIMRAISIYHSPNMSPLNDLDSTFNNFLKLINAVIASKSYSMFEQEQPTPFFNILFHLLNKLPANAVNNNTIQLLAEIRFQIGDSKLQEQFFRNLMQSSDYWLNTENLDVINEFWLFVKAIYSQNPIQYNRLFSIQNLIDLMVKISDIKDAGHCCEYHKTTYMMFYQGQIQSLHQNYQGRSSQLGGIVKREHSTSNIKEDKKLGQGNTSITPKNQSRAIEFREDNQKVNNTHQIDKYLAPIAGVLEGVLTTGGNEVLDQIQNIAKSLTVKSSPCFHLQMLKLLKVLLLDSREGDSQHCASPGDFAAQFLKANGLQILLYLCSNSSFDVKAMCVKLIDVLSSHTSLIKMSIDPDVLTYLCNIVLPRQMMEMANIREKSQIFKNIILGNDKMLRSVDKFESSNPNQYEMMDDENSGKEDENTAQVIDDSLEQLIMPPQKKQKKFGLGLFIEDDDDENSSNQIIKQADINLEVKYKSQPQKSLNVLAKPNEVQKAKQQSNDDYNMDDDLLPGTRPPPPAPKGSRGKMTMAFDFDSPESQPSQQDNSKQKFNQTSKAYIFGKQKTIAEVNEDEDDEEMEDIEALEQSDDMLQNFGILGFKSKDQKKESKKQFMNTQKLPQLKATNKTQTMTSSFQGEKRMNTKLLELTLDGQENEDQFDNFTSNQTNRNTFTGPSGDYKNRGAIQFAEYDNNDDSQIVGGRARKKSSTTFANENVMSKSNLRQPKSFNFGFQDSDGDNEDQEEEKKSEDSVLVDKVEEVEDLDQIASLYNQKGDEDDVYFESDFFKEKRIKETDLIDPDSFIIGGQKKGSSVVVQSQNTAGSVHHRGRSNIPAPLLNINDDDEDVLMIVPQRKNKIVGGTTGATSDTVMEESLSVERDNQIQQSQNQNQQQQPKSKKAVISFKKNARLFTNQNNKLNIDTDAINDLFTYGGENGQVKMSEDQEIINFEAEIEELASMCIAAMNRKTPNDPIKYENKNLQPTFESKYLGGGERQEEQAKTKDNKKGTGNMLQNPRSQFMTPQSVRGIKKIEFQMSHDEKQAALEGSRDRINLGSSLGSAGLSTSKAFGMKQGMFSNNTIQEELSPQSQSKSSTSINEIKFKKNQSIISQEAQAKNEKVKQLNSAIQKDKGDKKSQQKPTQHQSFNQTQPNLNFLSQLSQSIKEHEYKKKRSSDELILSHDGFRLDQSSNQNEDDNLFKDLVSQSDQNKGNDEYTLELENLYTSCLEWIISRAPSSLYENIVIDEVDKIGYQPAIQLLMILVTYSNNIIRQRALNDLEMLAKWDSNNGTQIMVHPQFHSWLLELLMPFQDLTSKYQNLQGTSLAVYDIGCKLHTLLLRNACTNSEEEAYKKINFLVRWPMIVQMQVNQGIKDRNERDIEIANKLVRVLLTQLISGLREDTSRLKPLIGKNLPTWQNLLYIISLVEELVFGSHNKTIHSDNIEQFRDVNVSLFKWIQKDYLLHYYGSNEKNLWAEWDLMEQIFQVIDSIYPEWIFKNEKNQHLRIEDIIFNTLEKCSADEFNSLVDILMHEGSPYKNQVNNSSQQVYQPPKQQQSKGKGLLRGVLGGGKSHHQDNSQQNQADQTPQNQVLNSQSENSFMKSLLNLMCITLTQADTKAQVQLWLDRLEKFVKFIIILSESWRSRLVSTIYNNYQRKFSEAITFAFTFIFHEIHHTPIQTTRSNQNLLGTLSQYSMTSNNSSPKDQKFNKQYAQCLKNLMIYFINVIEYQKMKYTPSQLESHITACRNIFTNYLIKNYQGGQEYLINMRDISRIKQSDYDDFPECFYMEDWKVTFFNNESIKRVVKKQMNQQALLHFIQKRRNYSVHYIEAQNSNDKTKDEILKRMQLETIEVIGQLSAEEFERKNKVALMNDNFIREQGHHWSKVKHSVFGSRGIWRFSLENDYSYLMLNMYRTEDGIRPYQYERHRNGFEFQEQEGDLERKIFTLVDSDPSIDFFEIDKNKLIQSKQHLLENKVRSNNKVQVNSSDDEEEDEKLEDEEEIGIQYTESEQTPIITFFSRTLTTREKISLKKQYINHLKEHIYTFRSKTKEIITDMRCSILKPFYQRPGSITLTSHDILFFDDLFTPANLLQEKDNIFFFKYQKKNDDLLYKIIPLHNLKEIQRRRFLGRKTGLEIFLMSNKSILLNFSSVDERDKFATKIIRQRNSKSYNLKYYDTLEPKRILKKRELTDKWMQWKISNFEYIMQLNILSGRSYNDLSQYPVFPWILTDFTSQNTPDISAASMITNQPAGVVPPPQGFRDLNKNMQLLGTAERQAEFKRKYDDQDSFASQKEKFHCGSHYSNPGIVLHYMSRLSPYIDALVELHGKNLDTPDRGFHSVQESLESALKDHADVRELIPEFYYCPEMFENHNQIKFGIKQDGNIVDSVKLPAWCNNDPYLFVIFLREAFESNYVSQNLSSWIDYIFGFKQRDGEAEKSLNLFAHITYEDGIDIDSITDQLMKQSYQEQIYNYGQTPAQLFQKNKHPQRIPRNQAIKYNCVVDNQSKIKVYKPVVQQPHKSNQGGQNQATPILLSQEAILKAKFADDQQIIGLSKDGTVTYFFWLSKAHELNPNTPFTCCEDKKRKFDNRQKQNGFEVYDRSIKKFDFPLQILHSQKCIMRGGFWDGKIAICPIEGVSQEPASILHAHQSTVTAITATQNEKIVITGSKSGDVIVWNYIGGSNNPSNESNWQLRQHICDHEGIISTIHINEEMKIYLTCSFDGSANIYNLWNDKFIKRILHPKLAPIHSGILSQTPLPVCCFFSREDHQWYSFTLNGHLLEKQREECSHIISPQVIKDSHFMEKLVYGTEKGYLIFRQLPLLRQFKKQQVSTQYPVLSIIVSPERRFLLVGCGDGGLNVVTEPFQISQSQPSMQHSNITSHHSATQSNTQTSSQYNQTTSSQGQNNQTLMNQTLGSSYISMTQSSIVSQPLVIQGGQNQNQQQLQQQQVKNQQMFGNLQQQMPNYHSQGSNQQSSSLQPQHQYRE